MSSYRAETDGCGCGQVHGWRVIGPDLEKLRLVDRLAAEHAAKLLNEEVITPGDLNILWGWADSQAAMRGAMDRMAAQGDLATYANQDLITRVLGPRSGQRHGGGTPPRGGDGLAAHLLP